MYLLSFGVLAAYLTFFCGSGWFQDIQVTIACLVETTQQVFPLSMGLSTIIDNNYHLVAVRLPLLCWLWFAIGCLSTSMTSALFCKPSELQIECRTNNWMLWSGHRVYLRCFANWPQPGVFFPPFLLHWSAIATCGLTRARAYSYHPVSWSILAMLLPRFCVAKGLLTLRLDR